MVGICTEQMFGKYCVTNIFVLETEDGPSVLGGLLGPQTVMVSGMAETE